MKKELLITSIAIFCFHIIATAQADKGTTLIGGGFYFNNKQYESPGHETNGQVQIKTGRAFTRNVVWGVQGGYSFANQKTTNGDTPKYSGFSAGVFNRLYKSLGNDFSLFGESTLGYSRANIKAGFNGNSYHQTAAGLGFTPGLAYKILDWANIELMLPNILSVNYVKSSPDDQLIKGTEETFSATTSLNNKPLNTLGVGFSVLF